MGFRLRTRSFAFHDASSWCHRRLCPICSSSRKDQMGWWSKAVTRHILSSLRGIKRLILLRCSRLCTQGECGHGEDCRVVLWLTPTPPRASTLIEGKDLALNLTKDEWISVLRLANAWDMRKVDFHQVSPWGEDGEALTDQYYLLWQIRTFAIHRLTTEFNLEPHEKFSLARSHRVAQWFEDAIEGLLDNDVTLEHLSTVGWETAARVLWIKNNMSFDTPPPPSTATNEAILFGPPHVRINCSIIRCTSCSGKLLDPSPTAIVCPSGCTATFLSAERKHILGSSPQIKVQWHLLSCGVCKMRMFSTPVECFSCKQSHSHTTWVKLAFGKGRKALVQEAFGNELKEYRSLDD